MPRLLLLAPNRRYELARAFQLGAQSVCGGIAAGADSDPHAPALACLDPKIILPEFHLSDCLPRLLDFCVAEKISAILPCTNKAVEFLDAHRAAIATAGVAVPYLPDHETLRDCHDKLRLARRLKSGRLLHCPTHTADSLPMPPIFPLFAKSRTGEGGRDTHILQDWRDLDYHRERFPDHIYQGFLPGDEYTIDWFADRYGVPRVIVPRKRLEVRDGETWRSRIELRTNLIDLAQNAGLHFGLRGPCTLQCREDALGNPRLIDINLRPGSATIHTILAGADIPALIYRDLNGDAVSFDPNTLKNGSLYTRHLSGNLVED